MRVIPPAPRSPRLRVAPDTNVLLSAARMPLMVSGDRHLLRVDGWRGVAIVTPRQFAARHLEGIEDRTRE